MLFRSSAARQQRRHRAGAQPGAQRLLHPVAQVAALAAAALHRRKAPGDELLAAHRARRAADLALEHHRAQRLLGGVVGGLDAGVAYEGPQRDLLREQVGAGLRGAPAA